MGEKIKKARIVRNLFNLVGKIYFRPEPDGARHKTLSGKTILAVAGDLGGWHATALVLAKLADGGANISVIFTGPSRCAFLEKSLEIDVRFEVQVEKHGHCDVIIVAPSQSRDGNDETVKIVKQIKDNIPVCVIEDMWGSAVLFLNKIHSHVLKRVSVCVVDQFAKKKLVKETKISAKKVFVTGGPQFDRVLELRKNWSEQRRLIRKKISNDACVYLVAGGVNGTDEILDLVQSVLRSQDAIIFRQHSRSTVKDKEQTKKAIEVIKQAGGKFLEVDKKIAPYTESLLAGSDFVLSGFSTTNRYAILLGIIGTIYVGTTSFRKDLWSEKKLKLPPEVEFGAGWYVQDAKEMKDVVAEVSAETAGKRKRELIKKQQKIAQFCDGEATSRVLDVIHNII